MGRPMIYYIQCCCCLFVELQDILHCGYVFRVSTGGTLTSSAYAVATSFRALLPTRRPVGTASSLIRRGLRSKTHKSNQRRRPCLTPRRTVTAGVAFDMHYADQSHCSPSEAVLSLDVARIYTHSSVQFGRIPMWNRVRREAAVGWWATASRIELVPGTSIHK